MKGYDSFIKARGLGTVEADSSQCHSLTLPPAPCSRHDSIWEGIDKRLSQATNDFWISAPYTYYYSLFFHSSHSISLCLSLSSFGHQRLKPLCLSWIMRHLPKVSYLGVHHTSHVTFGSFFLLLVVSLWGELQISLSPLGFSFDCLLHAVSYCISFIWLKKTKINVTTVFKYPEKYTGFPKDGTTIGQNRVTYLLQTALEWDCIICIFLSSFLSCLLSCALVIFGGSWVLCFWPPISSPSMQWNASSCF